jgi:hypothetical protein
LSESGSIQPKRRGEEGGQDQHALGVDRPAELDLALDVDDLALAERAPCAVMRVGWPKATGPSAATERPFT